MSDTNGRPEIQRFGNEWSFRWPVQGVLITVSGVRETAGGQLKAELTVQSTRQSESGLLYWGQVMLGAQAERDRIARSLAQSAPDVNWAAAIARLCQYVAHEFRKPEPLVQLAQVDPGATPAMLADPVLVTGQTNILFATGGAGKSYLALRVALSVCCGLELPWGGMPTQTGPVLYYDWETDARAQRRRLELLAGGLNLRQLPDNLYYRRVRGKLTDRLQLMRAELQRLGVVLVILDSLGFAAGGDLNSTEVAIPTMDGIADLGEGLTKLVLAHYAKEHRDSRRPASVYGSGFFEFAARSIWEVRRESAGGDEFLAGLFDRKGSDRKQRTSPLGLRFQFEVERGRVRIGPADLSDSAELEEHVPLRERLRTLLRRGPWRVDELAEQLGLERDRVRRELYRMPEAINLEPGRRGRGESGAWLIRDVAERNGRHPPAPAEPDEPEDEESFERLYPF